MDQRFLKFTNDFVENIKMTDEYKAYSNQVQIISHYPDLMEQLNAFRDENFRIQNEYEDDELYDKIEEFNQRKEKFLEDPRVDSFLRAEAAFCKAMQEINVYIMEGLNFQ